MGINHVLFRDEAGSVLAAVEWDTDEWVVFCDVSEGCEWRHRHGDLAASLEAAAAHVESHQPAGMVV